MKKIVILCLILLSSVAFAQVDDMSNDFYQAMRGDSTAKRDIIKKAEAGDAQAQYELGIVVSVMEKNDAVALSWFLKSAEQGYSTAQFELGGFYHKGLHGIKEDYNKAAEWYMKAAIQGNSNAQTNLANLYFNGLIGSGRDIVTGCAWAYFAKNQDSIICDKGLNQAQMTRTLYLMDNLKKEYPALQ